MNVSMRPPAARVLCLLSIVALAGCGPAEPAQKPDGRIWKQLAGDCYRIPDWNLAPDHASAVFPFFSESPAVARAVTLQFSTAAIKENIADYELPRATTGKLIDGQLVSLFLPDAPNLAQIRVNQKSIRDERDNLNLWYAQGDWTQRTIEPAPQPGYFRVSHFPGGHSWRVVTAMPDLSTRETHLAPDFWIGSCSLIEGTTLTSCLAKMERDGIFMDLHISEANLPYREQLMDYFLKTLAEWRVPCGGQAN